MGVKILRKKRHTEGLCGECHFDEYKDGNSCLNPHKYGERSYLMRCGLDYIFTLITPSEFNASTGKKWRVKKDGRVLPYEETLYLHINGEKYPVFPDDTAEEIEKRINDDLEYAEITIIMDDKK